MCISKAEAHDILWGWGKALAGGKDPKEPLGVSQITRWDVVPGGKGEVIEHDIVNPYFKDIDNLLKKMDKEFYDYAVFLYANTLPLSGAANERKIYALEKICDKYTMNAKRFALFSKEFWMKVTAVLG